MAAPASSLSAAHLPEAVTSFVGRRHELAGVRARMAESRLVTLAGAPGVGKTRLAIEVAAAARRAFPDGVRMVDLASLDVPADVAQTMLAALDVPDRSSRPPADKLVAHLRDRHALVVLDNCEHVLDVAALVTARLLRTCPRLHVLATSREPLSIDGEHIFTVPPLPAPDLSARPALDAVHAFESVQLLVERARAVRPDFAVGEDNHLAVAQLCARLDGLPLAIELAATRLRALDVSEVVARLDRRFAFLVGGRRDSSPRQRALQGLMDWSFELCTAEERTLWARLSVFAGSFDLEAAEAVCSGEGIARDGVADLLDRLVAKSLVAVDRDAGRLRYRMLVTVREYGAGLLAAAGAQEELRRRHRNHYLRIARDMAATWFEHRQLEFLGRLRLDHPNLRAALDWSLARPKEARAGASLASALQFHWYDGAFLSEGLRRLEQALAAVPEPTRERAEALWVAALLALAQGQMARTRAWLEELGALAQALGDPALVALDAHGAALVHLFGGDARGSLRPFEAAIAGHAAAGDLALMLSAQFEAIVACAYAGEHGRAREISRDALAVCERHGDRWALGFVHWATGVLDWREGRLDAARERALAALAGERELKRGLCVAYSLELLSWVAAGEGALEPAARLQGAARAVWSAMGTETGHWPQVADDSTATVRALTAGLGEARCRVLLREHAGATIDEAIDIATGGGLAHPPAHPGDALAPLSAREREVAGLIADGLSNRAIAEELILSPRTIDGHVERILAKLGFHSRTQIAVWVSERRDRATR